MRLTGVLDIDGSTIKLKQGATGSTTLSAGSPGSAITLTLPSEGTDTLVGKNTTDTLTNKTLTSPTLTTPSLGVATATSINGLTITTTTGTLTITNGKTLSVSNTLTFTGTDGSSVAFGTGGTVLYSGGALGTPSSGTLTNCTGLPISTGVSGLGTGVATALGNAVNTSGGLATSAVTSLSSLATVGTITSGVWNAGAVTSSGAVSGTYFSGSTSGTVTNTFASSNGVSQLFIQSGAAGLGAYATFKRSTTAYGEIGTDSTKTGLYFATYNPSFAYVGDFSLAGAFTAGPRTGTSGTLTHTFQSSSGNTYIAADPLSATGLAGILLNSNTTTKWTTLNNAASAHEWELRNAGNTVIATSTQAGALTLGPSGSTATNLNVNGAVSFTRAVTAGVDSGVAHTLNGEGLKLNRNAGGSYVLFQTSASDNCSIYGASTGFTFNNSSGTPTLSSTNAGAWTLGANGLNVSHQVYMSSTDIYTGTAFNTHVLEVRNFKSGATNNTALLQFRATTGDATASAWQLGNVVLSGSNASDFVFKAQTGVSSMAEYGRIGSDGAWTFGSTSANTTATVRGNLDIIRTDASKTSIGSLASVAYFDSYGVDNSTNGTFSIRSLRNNASNTIVGATMDGSGAWTLGPTSGLTTRHTFRNSAAAGEYVIDVFKYTGGDTSSNYYARFATDSADQGYIWNNAVGNIELITASDARLKENIRDADYGLAQITALRPVTFDWKSGAAKDVRGFIAQEVQSVLPRCVSEGPDGNLQLGKDEFIPILVKAVQELKAENDALKARIEALEGAT